MMIKISIYIEYSKYQKKIYINLNYFFTLRNEIIWDLVKYTYHKYMHAKGI